MPQLSRRGFLFAVIAGASALCAALVAWWRDRSAMRAPLPVTDVRPSADGTFVAIVDTIVPRDDHPGALDAGIADTLTEKLAAEPWRRDEYREIATAADVIAQLGFGNRFTALALESRTEVLLRLLRDRQHGDAGLNLAFLRLAVLRHYYASPAGQHMLDYQTPRHGYPGYDACPD